MFVKWFHRKKDNFLLWGLLLFALFPIIPNNLKGLPVIFLLLVSLIKYTKTKALWSDFIVNASLYLVFLLSLIYTENFGYALKKMETMLSIIILPLVFFVLIPKHEILKETKVKFAKVFIVSSAIFSLLVFLSFFLDNSTVFYQNWYANKFRVVVTDMIAIGQHPIYASIFLSISVIFYVQLIKTKNLKSISSQMFFGFLTVLNVVLMMILLSKGVLIALGITLVFSLVKHQKNIKFMRLGILVIIASFLLLFIFNRRMGELLVPEVYKEVNPNFSTSIRIGVYKCSLEKISENWLFGYGLGDSQIALNSCYEKKSNYLLANEFNTHSQYLDILLKTGVLGLLVFLVFLLSNLRRASSANNQVAFMIILFYGLVFLTENILSRQSGVILFYFLLLSFTRNGDENF